MPNRGGCIIAFAMHPFDKYTYTSSHLRFLLPLYYLPGFLESVYLLFTHLPYARHQTAKLSFLRTLTRPFFGRSTSPASMSSAKSKAQKIIDENSVVVFSKSYCPYCRATKSLLSEKHAKFFLMELDQVGK